uniref:Major capsid protein n=1 Tax=uncultured Caudovirales phage TaxID=2100421 RepID=A0A6J5L5N6_9CAUD|nr:hypothetical protein UFOVP114_58 [uncultured Caudovirales phage]
MFQNLAINSLAPVEDLLKLNAALREFGEGNLSKAGSIGYQVPAQISSGSNLSALVPQSIDPLLSVATFTMQELALWPMLAKRGVGQTVHEFNVVHEHGLDLDPFIAEGGAGTLNASNYERLSVRIKYLAERREVTDVATMVGLIGDNSNAIAEETERGTLRLLGKLERMLFFADSSLSALHFDGVFAQILARAPKNISDLGGKPVSPQYLQAVLGHMCGAPLYSRPDVIMVESRVHADLISQTVAYGRHDQVKVGETGLTFGTNELFIMGPYGKVPIKMAPFLFTAEPAPDAASSSTAPTAPSLSGGSPSTATDGASKFTGLDAGDYIYKFIGIGDKGYSDPIVTDPVAIESGDKVTIEIADGAKTGDGQTSGGIRYYKVYRSAKNGSADTCVFLCSLALNTDGSPHTRFYDLNKVIPGTSKILILQNSPDVIQFVKLLDFMRRPLAENETKKPFLLMLFGALAVKLPSKCWVIDNVGVNQSLITL